MEQLIQQTKSRKYNLPQYWSIKKFDEIGQVIDGDRGKNYPSKEDFLTLGDCLFLSAKNVTDEGFKFNELQFISAQRDSLMSKGKLEKKDIVLTTRGTVGNLAYYDSNIPYEKIRINSGMVILRLNDRSINNEFLFRAFQSEYINNQITKVIFGSAQPQLTVKIIENFHILFPNSKSEQRAIAEVLSDVDALIEAQEALIEKKSLIKQGVMQELLTGKRRLPGFSGEWAEATLRELGEISSSGVDKKIRQKEVPVRLLNYMDVYSKDFVTSKDLIQTVTTPIQKAQKCSIKKGDVFFTPSSETPNDIANSAVSLEDIENGVYSYHIYRFRFFEPEIWDLLFRSYIFKTKYFFDQAEKICAGSGQRYVINLSGFQLLKIKYPKAKEEQQAISQIIYNLDNEIEVLNKCLEKYKLIKEGMMQELLTGRIRLV